MAHDPKLADAMRKAMATRMNIEEKKMFGGICWMWNGNMLAGLETNRFMFRVGPELEAQAFARPGARPMEFTGRAMRGFVWVDGPAAIKYGLKKWVDLAAEYVGAMPKNAAKKTASKKKVVKKKKSVLKKAANRSKRA